MSMNTPSPADIKGLNLNEMDKEEEEEEEDNENWALPASTLPGQAAHHCSPLAVPSSHQIISGNKDLQSDNDRVSNIELNTNKAGMEGLDKEKINKIIMEASKGSRFYENQKKKEQQTTERINKMMEKLAGLKESEKQTALIQVDEMVKDLELSRDLTRTIVHLDMDMFYAAVEMRDNPELREKPMAVGGMGMLSTSNYKARRFGVRAAMPGFIGMKLCPELVLVPPHFDKYRTVSQQVRGILAEYDPNFCPMSLDEAYFDLTEYLERRQTMSAEERTYPYRSAEDHVEVQDKQKATSDEGSSSKSIQEKMGDKDVNTSSGSDPQQQTSGEDESLFTSVSKEQGDVTSGKVLSSPAKSLPTAMPESACCHGNTKDASSLEGSALEGECSEQPEQDMKNEIGMRGTNRQDGKFKTFGVTCEEVVREIRFRIEQKTMLTASAGIAPNCMLAKICSDKNKPNGQYRIPPTREDVMDFIRDLPIRKISGIGKVTERMLSALGIQTCTDLYQQRALCYLLFSQISSSYFLNISLGLGSTRVQRDGERKSVGTERTFKEISVPSELYSKCMELCEALAEDVKEEQIQGKTVTIKLKTVNFEVKTRASSLKTPVSSAHEIFAVARELLRTEIRACHPQLLRLRLMGVRLSSLQDAGKLSKSKQGNLLAMFAKKQNTSPQPSTTPTPDFTEPTVGLQGESTAVNNVSVIINTTDEVSDTSRSEELAPDTDMFGTTAGVGASVDTTEEVSDMSGTEVLDPDTEDFRSSAGVGASVDHAEGVEEEGVVSPSKQAPEDKDSPSVVVSISVNKVDSTVSSDTEISPEQTFESANAEDDTKTTDTGSTPHRSLHHSSQSEPRLPFCEEVFVSGTEENHPSFADMHREGHTEQLYHPELLSKSEIFSQENNQRLDKMLKMDSQAKADKCGSKCTSSIEAQKMTTCPICGQERAYSSLEEVNRHLDMCLNKSAIKEMLHKEKSKSSSSSTSQHRKSDPKKLPSRKRSRSSSGSSSSKKKRSKSTPCRTLYDFFQKKD